MTNNVKLAPEAEAQIRALDDDIAKSLLFAFSEHLTTLRQEDANPIDTLEDGVYHLDISVEDLERTTQQFAIHFVYLHPAVATRMPILLVTQVIHLDSVSAPGCLLPIR